MSMRENCEPGHHDWEKYRMEIEGDWWYQCQKCGKREREP